jgi:hypothetical protein
MFVDFGGILIICFMNENKNKENFKFLSLTLDGQPRRVSFVAGDQSRSSPWEIKVQWGNNAMKRDWIGCQNFQLKRNLFPLVASPSLDLTIPSRTL